MLAKLAVNVDELTNNVGELKVTQDYLHEHTSELREHTSELRGTIGQQAELIHLAARRADSSEVQASTVAGALGMLLQQNMQMMQNLQGPAMGTCPAMLPPPGFFSTVPPPGLVPGGGAADFSSGGIWTADWPWTSEACVIGWDACTCGDFDLGSWSDLGRLHISGGRYALGQRSYGGASGSD